MKLQDCRHFDSLLLIRFIHKVGDKKKELENELESLSEIPSNGIDKSGVRGTNISDPTSQMAIRRETIIDELKDIEICEEAYEYGKDQLDEDELEIFRIFFEPKKPIWREIDDYTAKKYTCRMNVYKLRRKVLKKLDKVIEERYFL